MTAYVEELFGLDEKVAVVIGGSGVLGGRMAEALAGAGAKVAVVYHNNKEGAERRVEAIGAGALAVAANVQSRRDTEALRNAVLEAWGRVDILVNAPGVNSPTPVLEITEDEWQRILDTNLKGVFLACQVFGAHMIEQGEGGSVINVSSASSRVPSRRLSRTRSPKRGSITSHGFLPGSGRRIRSA